MTGISGVSTASLTPGATTATAGVDQTALVSQLASVLTALQQAVAALSQLIGGGAAAAPQASVAAQTGASTIAPVTAGGATSTLPVTPSAFQIPGVDTTATQGGGTTTQAASVPMSTATKVDGTQGSNVPGRAKINPPNPNDPRFIAGTTGPVVKKGKAKTIKLKNGVDLNGKKGRRQNAGDKKQNNYSVTDANYNADLGVPKTIMGKATTYDSLISGYSAAGFIEEFYPDVYAKLVQSQNAGKGTVVEMSLALTGWSTPETAAQVKALGIDPGQITKVVPGSGIDLKTYIGSGKDITGQDWARPHHALSQWHAFHELLLDGVDAKTAHVLSGDDAVSGSGRVNGVNNQDNNKSGMNNGEQNTYAFAVKYAKEHNLDANKIVGDMLGSHAMTNLSPGTLTNPKINKLIGAGKSERAATADRVAAIVQGFASNKITGNENNKDDSRADNKGLIGTIDAAAGRQALQMFQNMPTMANMPAGMAM